MSTRAPVARVVGGVVTGGIGHPLAGCPVAGAALRLMGGPSSKPWVEWDESQSGMREGQDPITAGFQAGKPT